MLKTTKSDKNLSTSGDMAKDAEVSVGGGDDETVKKSPPKKSNGLTGYFTSLRSNVDSAPLAKR